MFSWRWGKDFLYMVVKPCILGCAEVRSLPLQETRSTPHWEQIYCIEEVLATLLGLFSAPSDSAQVTLCPLNPSVRPCVYVTDIDALMFVVLWLFQWRVFSCKRDADQDYLI